MTQQNRRRGQKPADPASDDPGDYAGQVAALARRARKPTLRAEYGTALVPIYLYSRGQPDELAALLTRGDQLSDDARVLLASMLIDPVPDALPRLAQMRKPLPKPLRSGRKRAKYNADILLRDTLRVAYREEMTRIIAEDRERGGPPDGEKRTVPQRAADAVRERPELRALKLTRSGVLLAKITPRS